MMVKQCESVRSWTSWCKETGAVHTERAPLKAPPRVRVSRVRQEQRKMKKQIKRSTDDFEEDRGKKKVEESTVVTAALNVKWSAFEEESIQSTVTRYELQYRYSARAKWVRVRRGLDGDSRSYVLEIQVCVISM